MRPVAFAARSLRREFRHGELATLAAALVLAVAALTAVGTLASRVESAILASAAELLGGDLGVSARREALPESFSSEAGKLDLEGMISAKKDIGEVKEALTAMTSGEVVRTVLTF